ncbi:PepSY domain-containing protein [Altererythrobacter sp.]|nr:PepSY domain-containing protein [Altererythrobacter sp.]
MKQVLSAFIGIALLASGLATPVLAQERTPQREARKEMRAGNVLSLRAIERKVLPTMRGAEYLGPAYDSAAMAYRLKFLRDGRVMFVDVDARTGKILNRSR